MSGQPARLTHHRLSPSGSKRWFVCPASPDYEKGFPESKSIHAAEGTAAHFVCEDCLLNDKEAVETLGNKYHVEGWDFVVTDEMAEAVQVYLDHINGLCEDGTEVGIEKSFTLPKIHEELGGTCDCLLWHPERKHLDVIDFKYGRGVPVDVLDNSQLLIYGLGAMYEVGFKGDWKENSLTLRVVQPRAQHPDGRVRVATYSWGWVHEWAMGVLAPAVKACDEPNPPRVPGDHCRFCRALAACPEKKQRMSALIKADFDDVNAPALVKPESLAMGDVDTILLHSTEIRDWLNAVESLAQARVTSGKWALDHHMLARKGTKRRWIDKGATEKVLEKLVGEKAFKKTVITPAQAEKIVGKKAVVKLCERPEGALHLVKRDSKAQEVLPNNCKEFFDSHDLLQ